MSRYHMTQHLKSPAGFMDPLEDEWYVLDTYTGAYVWVGDLEVARAETTRLNHLPNLCTKCRAERVDGE